MGGCFSVSDEDERYEHDPDYKGPTDERKCRDVFFLLLFIAFWFGMFVVAGIGYSRGAPLRMVYPEDMNGQTCGIDNSIYQAEGKDFTEQKYLYFPDVTDRSVQICISACPTSGSISDSYQIGTSTPCNTNELICRYGETQSTSNFYTVNPRKCWCPYKTKSYLRRCLPNLDSGAQANETAAAEQAESEAKSQPLAYQLFGDIVTAWWWILVCVVLAVLFSFAYLWAMKSFAKPMVYLTIGLSILMLIAFTAYTWGLASELQTEAENDPSKESNANAMQIVAYIFVGITIVTVLVIIWLRKRIQLAIQIVIQASYAMQAMPQIVLFPLALAGVFIVFLFYWVSVAIFLASAKTYNEVDQEFQYDTSTQYAIIYHFFGLLWTTQFLIAIGFTTIAGAIATWYWAPGDSREEKDANLSGNPVMESLRRVYKYHLGSMAFGALVIAVVQFIRAVLRYIEEQAKESQNRIALYVVRCLQCCFACVEKIMKFVSRNGYIMVAITGKSFCSSCVKALKLITRNVVRVAVVNGIGDFLLFLGKVIVTMLVGIIAAAYLRSNDELRFWFFPWVLIVMLTWGVTSMFMGMYELAIDTILLSFCEDIERNDGSAEKPYRMTKELEEFINESERKYNAKVKPKQEDGDDE